MSTPRGIPPMVVEDVIKNGEKALGQEPGTWDYFGSNIKVISNENGDIITTYYYIQGKK